MTDSFLFYRAIECKDVLGCFNVLNQVRENYISREELNHNGITSEAVHCAIENELVLGYVCIFMDDVIGFTFSDVATGQILALSVLPQFEAKGIGRRLLDTMGQTLKVLGFSNIYLAASPNRSTRAYGFYRHLGWIASGDQNQFGDEVLIKSL